MFRITYDLCYFCNCHCHEPAQEKYEGKSDEFIQFISDESVVVEGSYKETWEYIEKDLNSLNRHSNMNLIFEKE